MGRQVVDKGTMGKPALWSEFALHQPNRALHDVRGIALQEELGGASSVCRGAPFGPESWAPLRTETADIATVVDVMRGPRLQNLSVFGPNKRETNLEID